MTPYRIDRGSALDLGGSEVNLPPRGGFGVLGFTQDLYSNSPVVAGCGPRGYISGAPHSKGTEGFAMGDGALHCFRGPVLLLFFLSFLP